MVISNFFFALQLKEVDLEISSIVPPSQLEQNGTNHHDNDQSLCSSHDHVNKDNAEFQQETSATLVDGTESRNIDHLQEDDAAAVGLAARLQEESPVDENVPLGPVHASAGCNATLQGSTTEPLSKDAEVFAAMVQPQSPREQHPNAPPHNIDAERLHDDGARDQSLKPSCEGLETRDPVAPTVDRSSDALATNASEPGDLPESVTPDGTIISSQPHSSKTDMNVLQHESGEKVNQVLDDDNASIQQMEKDHIHEDLTLQTTSVLPSVSCNDAIQGGQSETNHMPGNATDHTTVCEDQNGDKSRTELSGADKANEAQPHSANILEKNTVHGGLNVQAAPLSQNCNLALHDNVSEVNCSFEQNTGRSRTDAQKNNCSTSVLNITQDGTTTSTTNTLNKSNLGDASARIPHVPSSDDNLHGIAAAGLMSMTNKMPFWPKDQELNHSLEGLSQQDLCIKCGKAGQLLKCSGCLLAAHDSCFGSSVTFQETGLFYCPVCFYTKATEAYQKARKVYYEARKNLATFLGTTQVAGQQDELLNGVLPRAPNKDGQSNVSDSSKRKNIHQQEAANLAHRDEEPGQQRKKQKFYATGSGYTEEVVTEDTSRLRNSNIVTMGKQSVLKGNSRNQVGGAERQQLGGNKEAGNINSFHETRRSPENRCQHPANEEAEADEEDGPTKSHQSNDSDEIEATSSNGSGKRSSPPWRKMRHSKSRLQEKETVVSSKSRKIIAQQDQHTSSPSRKRNYAPQKR
jgi:hypothetical protein